MTGQVVASSVAVALVAAFAVPMTRAQEQAREVKPDVVREISPEMAREVALVREVAPEPARTVTQEPARQVTPEPAPGTSSQEMNSVLDLAKLYFSQGRFEEAQGMLARAQAIVNQMQTATPVDATTSISTVLPPGVVRIGGDIKPPTRIRNVSPVYPREAKAAKVQGIVIVEAIVDTRGNVTDARVLRGVPMLNDSALAAVRQWRFTPTLMNGVPVSVAMTVTVNFTLGH